MTVTPATKVADIAAALPASVRVFQRYGIDFCCGGRKPLGAACEEHQLAYEEIAGAIAEAAAVRVADARDWTREPLGALIDHIVATYHEPLRVELPRLRQMATRVHRVHGDKAPQLLGRLAAIVDELASDLDFHMQKEERVLFPAVGQLEAGAEGAMGVVGIAAPITVMEQEHDEAAARLDELRTITGGYAAPEWACQTFRSLYHGLEELEREMHVHVHLENNVLFPRTLALAGLDNGSAAAPRQRPG